MSADNGIYIAQFPDGWRWVHTCGIDYLYDTSVGSNEWKQIMWDLFGDREVYKDLESCMTEAIEFSKTLAILEYGVCQIGSFESLTKPSE